MFLYANEVFSSYYREPTEEKLITLLFTLNHLRDWITGGEGWDRINEIPENKRSAEQLFYQRIYDLPEYKKIVNPLCNGLKHCKIELQTEEIAGLRCGIGRAGDSLGQKYYLIDGKDSRTIFHTVLEEYRKWFDKIP